MPGGQFVILRPCAQGLRQPLPVRSGNQRVVRAVENQHLRVGRGGEIVGGGQRIFNQKRRHKRHFVAD